MNDDVSAVGSLSQFQPTVRPLPVEQPLREPLGSIVDEAEPGDREECVALLGGATPVPAFHDRHPAPLVRVGLGIDLEVHVEPRLEPALDDPIAERFEGRILRPDTQDQRGHAAPSARPATSRRSAEHARRQHHMALEQLPDLGDSRISACSARIGAESRSSPRTCTRSFHRTEGSSESRSSAMTAEASIDAVTSAMTTSYEHFMDVCEEFGRRPAPA